MRNTVPPDGGGVLISPVAGSSWPLLSAGVWKVRQSWVATRSPTGRVRTLGAAPSMMTIALPFSSWPVTTRRMSCIASSPDGDDEGRLLPFPAPSANRGDPARVLQRFQVCRRFRSRLRRNPAGSRRTRCIAGIFRTRLQSSSATAWSPAPSRSACGGRSRRRAPLRAAWSCWCSPVRVRHRRRTGRGPSPRGISGRASVASVNSARPARPSTAIRASANGIEKRASPMVLGSWWIRVSRTRRLVLTDMDEMSPPSNPAFVLQREQTRSSRGGSARRWGTA